MHIRRDFRRSEQIMPTKDIILSNKDITITILETACEECVIDSTLHKHITRIINSAKKATLDDCVRWIKDLMSYFDRYVASEPILFPLDMQTQIKIYFMQK
ncbi:uncharacterized protein BX663DRAFT_484273 [Cokeromyces recurvatus]|uniref:uncharacterized protein n=1 Tax=Cokeromyces recurvatus TaxID=90255 RepID=UPI002220CC6A|nr:uncharacterized protein BX663DRAFT_484273 [Cokeromyces recurvatus]KAI7904910.1 hypothetical protein BX663DRAFT_484273 [Cokeromyces recurvatus]